MIPPDPAATSAATSTASTAASAGSSIMVAGLATGLPAELIFPAFVGALWALRSAGQGGHLARVAQVIIGTLFAAWTATPVTLVAASITASITPEVSGISVDHISYPVAFCLGWGGLNIVLDRIGRHMGGIQ